MEDSLDETAIIDQADNFGRLSRSVGQNYFSEVNPKRTSPYGKRKSIAMRERSHRSSPSRRDQANEVSERILTSEQSEN